MNEGTLKAKWIRWARKQGVWCRSLSPHHIPGLPDIMVVDMATDPLVRDLTRARVHLIEAKVANPGPKTFDPFRDAAPEQIRWVVGMRMMGAPAWWLVLDPTRWLLVRADLESVTRAQFMRRGRKYGSRVEGIAEPERERHVAADAMKAQLDKLDLTVARKAKKGRK